MHLVWIADTGTHYMNDVLTLGRLFFPVMLPYGLLAAALSSLCGSGKIEKFSALALFGVIAIALLLGSSIKVNGDKWDLFSDIRRQFEPRHSWAPWLLIGLCFHQAVVAAFRRKSYLRLWPFALAGFALAYAALGYVYITSRIHPGFPMSSTLPDAILVFCIGSFFFGMLSTLILSFYDMPMTAFPYKNRKKAQPEDRQLSSEAAPSASPDEVSS